MIHLPPQKKSRASLGELLPEVKEGDTIEDLDAMEVTMQSGQDTLFRDSNTGTRLRSTEAGIDTLTREEFQGLVQRGWANNLVVGSIVPSGTVIPVLALLDTGAIHQNYISKRLVESWGLSMEPQRVNIRTAVDTVHQSTHRCKTVFSFFNEATRKFEDIEIIAQVIDTQFDVIIGRKTMLAHQLLNKVPIQFWGAEAENCAQRIAEVEESLAVADECIATDFLASILHQNELLTGSGEDMEDVLRDTTIDPELYSTTPEQGKIPKDIQGSETLQRALRDLCTEYVDLFSKHVRPTPADVPPFHLNLNEEQWHQPKNRGPPRPLTEKKTQVLREMIQQLLDLHVIQESQAAHYSQVHLVPKPGVDKWRFCLDFRMLNAVSECLGWPIPNIRSLLQRILSKRANHFAIFDLTSGYHQTAIDPESRQYTAFICPFGVYEWRRVPMGLKGAPSYFQHAMASKVLGGLLYTVCELYIDDIIIWGTTEEEFLANVRAVFQRLREHNVTVNPEKCTLGAQVIQYVGHELTGNTLTFSRNKIEEILEIQKPTTYLGLKQFIGMANYMREHIRGFSIIIDPLHTLIPSYSKAVAKHALQWTPGADQAYDSIIVALRKLPALYVLDPALPTFMETDACDYGISAYLYQLAPDGSHRPISFISKKLTGSQKNWSTDVKEAYAIYYAFCKCEFLIRDIHFTLRTDHKNLTFLNKGSGKILRWKLSIQDFDFDIEHIKGTNNIMADALSRLCGETDTVEQQEDLEEEWEVPEEDTEILGALTAEDLLGQSYLIPPDIRADLERCHNDTVGHFGSNITFLRMVDVCGHDRAGLRKHVQTFIGECANCQLQSQVYPPIYTSRFVTSTYRPMECLNIDAIGPFPTTDEGYQYILCIVDTFSRFTELYPMVSTDAISAATAVLQHVGRYGMPSKIRTDMGPQFWNGLFDELQRMMTWDHEYNIQYSHQDGAIVERVNKEVGRHLQNLILRERIQTRWWIYLPLVQRIINAKTHETTGMAPASIMFGNQIDLDRRLLTNPIATITGNYAEFVQTLVEAQETLHQEAVERVIAHDIQHLNSTEGQEPTKFAIGSYVLLAYPHGHRPPTKLNLRWMGPLEIIHIHGAEYTLLDLITDREVYTHVSRLKEYSPNYLFTPVQAAAMSGFQWLVARIHEHTGATKEHLRFLIEWEGFPERNNYTWEPWSATLGGNIIIRNYIQAHQRLRVLLSEIFRTTSSNDMQVIRRSNRTPAPTQDDDYVATIESAQEGGKEKGTVIV